MKTGIGFVAELHRTAIYLFFGVDSQVIRRCAAKVSSPDANRQVGARHSRAARTRALDDFIERACDLFQYSLRLGSFLCVASSNVDSYREKRGCKEFEPEPCALCAAGVPCEFTEEVGAARRQNASCSSPSSHVQPDAKIHGGTSFAYLRRLRESALLPCESPTTVTVMETSPPSQPPSKPQAIQAAQSAAAKRHSFNYDPTAAALAVEMCRLHGAQP